MILLDPDAKPIIAHRGASGDFPENTMVAFEQGLSSGADALEFDVRVSAEGIPVVIHDETVDRTTNGNGPVRSKSIGEIAELDCGDGARIPLVDEVLETFADTPMIVEVKELAAAIPLAETIDRHGARDRVLMGSFGREMLIPFDRRGFVRSASSPETAWFWAFSKIGYAQRNRPYIAFTVPVKHGRLTVVDRSFVKTARKVGFPVHVWTVDDISEARRLRSLGVAGIITNYPQQMMQL